MALNANCIIVGEAQNKALLYLEHVDHALIYLPEMANTSSLWPSFEWFNVYFTAIFEIGPYWIVTCCCDRWY